MAENDTTTEEQVTATAEVTEATTPAPAQPSEAELKAQIKAMVDKGEFGSEFAKLSKQLAGLQAKREADEREAKQKALVDITEKVKDVIMKATEPLLKEIEAKGGDGIWFVSDWGEALVDVKLMKKAPAKAKSSGGGGGGKKFSISTDELLAKHGDKMFDESMTFRQAHESTTDGNFRYKVRTKLLKEDGLI